MRAKLAVVSILLCISAVSATTEDCDCLFESFDILGGHVQTLHTGELTVGLLIKCTFSIEDVYFDQSWLSSLNIIFLPKEQPDEGKRLIRLTAFRAEEGEGWQHHLVVEDPDSHQSRITAYTGRSDTVLPMNMYLADENFVGFYVGDDASNLSLIDVSNLDPITWEVIVSGMKGTVDCGDLEVR